MKEFTVVIEKDENGIYIASVPELPEITFASFLIPSTRYGLIDPSVNKSTFTPRNSDSSLSILTIVSRPFVSENSTRTSISLSGLSSPLA
jgi:Uncharacterized conserved protein